MFNVNKSSLRSYTIIFHLNLYLYVTHAILIVHIGNNNINLCLNFSRSSFIHSTFFLLSCDSHTVKRSVLKKEKKNVYVQRINILLAMSFYCPITVAARFVLVLLKTEKRMNVTPLIHAFGCP